MDTISKNQYHILKACSKGYKHISELNADDVSYLYSKDCLETLDIFHETAVDNPLNYYITTYPEGVNAMKNYRKAKLNSILLIATLVVGVVSAVVGVISLL